MPTRAHARCPQESPWIPLLGDRLKEQVETHGSKYLQIQSFFRSQVLSDVIAFGTSHRHAWVLRYCTGVLAMHIQYKDCFFLWSISERPDKVYSAAVLPVSPEGLGKIQVSKLQGLYT